MMTQQHIKANYRINGLRICHLEINGQLQSGDPMTTWSNTFNIICYQNFYVRTLPFARDSFGLIANNSEHALWVSGDDQLY